MPRLLLAIAAFALLVGSLQAQLRTTALAPELTSATWLNHKKGFTLEELHGRAVLLVFWDDVDDESMLEGPPLEDLWQSPRETGVVLLSISAQSPEAVQAYLDTHGSSIPVATDCRAAELYSVADRGYFFLLGWDGRVIMSTEEPSLELRNQATAAVKEAKDNSHIWDPRPLPSGVDMEDFLEYCLDGKMSKAEKAMGKVLDKAEDAPMAVQDDVAGLVIFMYFRPMVREGIAEDLAKKGRAYEATMVCKRSADVLKGTEMDDDFKDLAKSIKKEYKKVYALDKKRVAAVELAFRGDRDGALKALRALEPKVEGTTLEPFLHVEILNVESMGTLAPAAE